MQKFFKDHLNQAICYLASYKPTLQKLTLGRLFSIPKNGRQVGVTLSAEKDVNPALAQFAFIFQKHEFLI